jgi:hypothetical protein
MSVAVHGRRGRLGAGGESFGVTVATPKRGELLAYRPRTELKSDETVVVLEVVPNEPKKPVRSEEPTVLLHCCGRDFLVRVSMAQIFLRRSRDIVARGGAELVPLLHDGGVDLLLITPSTPLTVRPNESTPGG